MYASRFSWDYHCYPVHRCLASITNNSYMEPSSLLLCVSCEKRCFWMCKHPDNCALPGKVSRPTHALPVLLINLFRACSFPFSPMKASASSTLNPMTSPHLHLVKDIFGIKNALAEKKKNKKNKDIQKKKHHIAKMRLVVLNVQCMFH